MSRGCSFSPVRSDVLASGTPPLGLPSPPDGRALAFPPKPASGGADRARTGDPLVANQVLSQLSYSPGFRLVGLSGFEPLTSRLSAVRSSQLSYRPVASGPRQLRGRGFFEGRSPKERRPARRPSGWLVENWVETARDRREGLGLDPLERR